MDEARRRPRVGLIVANPAAGQVSPELVAEIVRGCAPLEETSVSWTTARGDATAMAYRAAAVPVETGPDLVVAVGGDGTVREVIEGLVAAGRAPSGPDLLIVPAGTGNSGYLAQWGEQPWWRSLSAAVSGFGVTRRLLDLARIEETGDLVSLGACAGLIAEALYDARDVSLSGRPRYRVALERAAARCRPYAGEVQVDGAVLHRGPVVLANVGGGRHRGGQYQVLPHSLLDDGLLDVCVIGGDMDPREVPDLTREAAHLGQPGTTYGRGRRITLERTDGRPLCFEHDGELLDGVSTTFTLQVLPAAVPVLCAADAPTLTAPGRAAG